MRNIEMGMIATLLASSVSPATYQVGLGTTPGGEVTEFAPSTHRKLKIVSGRPCSIAATMINASPIVEISAAIGGAWRAGNGRRQTCSMTRPINAAIAT